MAAQLSDIAKELEAYVRLVDGHMIYLASSQSWVVTFPTPYGTTAQIRIEEGTPLDDAVAAIAQAYETVAGSAKGAGVFSTE